MGVQIVIFGASGDLTARKLVPALVGSAAAGAFTKRVQLIGVARRPKKTAEWRAELETWLDDEGKSRWAQFADQVHYAQCDVLQDGQAERLHHLLDSLAVEDGLDPKTVGRLYYLALKPDLFAPVVERLSAERMLAERTPEAFRRVVVEKPFGTDLESALALNSRLRAHLKEHQIFRIDHYLGKETVQNILALRFQNAIFEPLWNRKHIESVEISVCESLGMESGRGRYYDTAGALRDMMQNHLLQVLALVAMEPPSSMNADAVRNEKVKVLESLTPYRPEQVAENVVRAQYLGDDDRCGYRQEDGVPDDSQTETFLAARAQIHNWRWSGVPFLLRTGKRLNARYTQVVLRFKAPPLDLLGGPSEFDICPLRPNTLRILIQPSEGIRLDFLVKQPGAGAVMRPSTLGFDYADLETGPSAPAYQRLLLDAIEGNATLFIRADEVEAAWRFADSIRAGWTSTEAPMHTYRSGERGPEAADALFRGCEGVWAEPDL